MSNEQATAQTTTPQLKGVDLARVNLTTLNAALKEAGIKVTAKTKVEERVKLLQEYELAQCPNDDELPEQDRKLGDCSECFGVSQLSRPACPYCGTSEEQPSAAAPVQAPPPRSPKAAKAKEPKAPKADEAPTEESKAVVKAEGGKITKKNIQEIEGLERRIKGLMEDSKVSFWKLGRELQGVFTTGAWKYRVDAEGKLLFKGFGEWVKSTFDISPQYARDLMAIASTYNEKEVRALGTAKLTILLRLPPEQREVVAEQAGNMSLKEVSTEVRRLAPGGTRGAATRTDSKARPHLSGKNAEQATARRIKSANEVTAVFALSRYELPMFARAKSIESGEPIRARTVNADPHGVLDLHNGVRVHVQIVEDENGLGVVLDFKREASEEEDAAE